jgi:leader peptidase (prepilin peptidase) / N-methyltransferase
MLESLTFVFGAIIGSFLNVCIYRLPRDKSVVRPPSACPDCGMRIRYYDNIPILSYFLLKGKCRTCGVRLSPIYPVVEALTGLLFLFIFRMNGLAAESGVLMLFTALLIVISFVDLEFQIIPDVLSLGGLGAGLALSFMRPLLGYKDAFIGAALGGGLLFGIAYGYQLATKREGMGGGDIKLLGMIGAFCGLKGVIFSLFSGSLMGTFVGVPLMLINRRGMRYAIPFGPFLSAGALVYVFFGDYLIEAFMTLVLGY